MDSVLRVYSIRVDEVLLKLDLDYLLSGWLHHILKTIEEYAIFSKKTYLTV
jgi:hypothetical protein